MKFAPIVPVPMLDSIKDNDYHMILVGQCKAGSFGDDVYANDYSAFYHHLDAFKILDNGIAEGSQVGTEELLWWANYVDAHEVVAPDVMHNAEGTIERMEPFCREARAAGVGAMVVLQATTWIEFHEVLEAALNSYPASVALPKLLCSHLGGMARLAAAEMIRATGSDIPIHCLGCPKHLSEARDLARQGIVRGIDSAAPVVLGLQGQPIRHVEYNWQTSHSAIKDYWRQEANEQVEVNLELFNEWCAGH